MKTATTLLATLFLSLLSPAQTKSAIKTPVPFVGCKSDGQLGPLAAPKGKPKLVSLPPEAASTLAYYQDENSPGVLAPRGWHCFGTYGSNGSSLFISPDPLSITLGKNWKGLSGPAIQLSISISDTSGRFESAAIIARVFPAHKAFVKDVIAEGIVPAAELPFGPFPKDKLTYKSKGEVEYETPPQTDGLGTKSKLLKNSDPIRGVEILTGEELSLVSLSIRLPANMTALGSAIIQQVERETPGIAPTK